MHIHQSRFGRIVQQLKHNITGYTGLITTVDYQLGDADAGVQCRTVYQDSMAIVAVRPFEG